MVPPDGPLRCINGSSRWSRKMHQWFLQMIQGDMPMIPSPRCLQGDTPMVPPRCAPLYANGLPPPPRCSREMHQWFFKMVQGYTSMVAPDRSRVIRQLSPEVFEEIRNWSRSKMYLVIQLTRCAPCTDDCFPFLQDVYDPPQMFTSICRYGLYDRLGTICPNCGLGCSTGSRVEWAPMLSGQCV